jgi:hypothetical protein
MPLLKKRIVSNLPLPRSKSRDAACCVLRADIILGLLFNRQDEGKIFI